MRAESERTIEWQRRTSEDSEIRIGIDGRGPFLDARHRLCRVAAGAAQRGLDLGALFRLMLLHQFQQDRLLVRKVRVERALRKPRSFRDVADRGQGEAAFHDLAARRLNQETPGTSLTFLAI